MRPRTLLDGLVPRRGAVRCAVLLDGGAARVDDGPAAGTRAFVVLDDACERLERIASERMRAGPVGAWQRRALGRSLAASDAERGAAPTLLALGRNATAEARACLVRTRLTGAARAGLDALAADGARIASVTTVARLLARVYARHPVPRLFVARTDVDERHVLVVDGVPCFSRTVVPEAATAATAATATAAAVAQSLEHLAGRYAAGRMDVACIGLDDATLDACRALEHVGETVRVSRADLATTLRARLRERARGLGARRRTAHVPALLPAPAGTGASDAPAGGGVGGTARRLVPAALSACLVVATAGQALGAHLRAERAAASGLAERARLEAELERERETLARLHERPLEAAASLARAESIDAGAPADASSLLALVGTALRDHDALQLDSVAWSTPSAFGGDAVHADAASLPVRVPGTGTDGALEVELAGRVLGAADVLEAERAVDGFARSLAGLARVGTPVRLDSPLERAAAGGLVAPTGMGEGTGASVPDGVRGANAWRLRFALAGRGPER